MAYDTSGVEHFSIPDFKFASGHESTIRVAYRSFNQASKKGTVLIATCFQGRINKTSNFITGALKEHHVIVVAMLGNGESSSPSNDANFPSDYSLSYEDCVNAQYTLVTQHFHLDHLEAVIGFSMGGQQAYYWAAMHGCGSPPFVKRAIVICGSARTSGHNYAFLEGPISALTASADYDGGRYKAAGIKPTQGLQAFGRAYAGWVPSPEWFRQELWRSDKASTVAEWLDSQGKSCEKWDAEDLLVIARMWQKGDIGRVAGDGDYKKTLSEIHSQMLVMPSTTDQYFRHEDSEVEVAELRNVVYAPIPSIWGHMAGGGGNPSDKDWMDAKIADFLSNT